MCIRDRPRIQPSVDFSQEVEGLGAGETGPESSLTGNVGYPFMRFDHLMPRVQPEDPGTATTGLKQSQEQADGGGLASPIRPQVSQDGTLGYLKVQWRQCLDGAEVFGQTFYFDSCGQSSLAFRWNMRSAS